MDVAYSVSSDSAGNAINDITSDKYVSLSDSDETIHYYASLVIAFATFTMYLLCLT